MSKFLLLMVVFGVYLVPTQPHRLLRRACDGYQYQYNVVDYGAAGDGLTDDTQAFKEAWEATCKSSACSPILYVPNGRTFLLQPLTFSGNCASNNVTVQIEGEIVAPSDPQEWKCPNHKCKEWITFHKIKGLFIHGYGTLNPQGSSWWNFCKLHKKECKKKATGLTISNSENVRINDLSFKNSPKMHIAFERSNWVYASNLTINAPWDSPNTDGIHLQHATNIFIYNSRIETGDDCISISDGSKYVNIDNIICGPGHGISIGSLGKNGKKEKVEFIHVTNSRFVGTKNGVRIKSWQGGRGYARNIVFEHIISENAFNPIIIDQYYCPHKKCSNQTSTVHIGDITYKDIYGTSNTKEAVNLACSKSDACSNIFMENIYLVPSATLESQNETNTVSYCFNVHGYSRGQVSPTVPCLDNLILW